MNRGGQLALERVTAWVVVLVVDGVVVVVVALAVVEVVLAVVEAVAVPVVAPTDDDPVDRVAGVADTVVDWSEVPASDAETTLVSLVDVAVVDATGAVWAITAAPPRTPARPAALTAARDRHERRQRFRVAVLIRLGARCSVMGLTLRRLGKGPLRAG